GDKKDRILSDVRNSANDIAGVLKGLYNKQAEEAASILNGLKKDATQIANALKGIYGKASDEAARILKGLQKDATQITGALMSAYDTASKDVARILNDLNFKLSEIATGIYTWVSGDKLASTFWAIANAAGLGPVAGLNGLTGANLLKNDSFEVAKFLLNQAKT